MESPIDLIQLIFIPNIQFKTGYGEIMSISSSIFKDQMKPKGMIWQTGDVWINAWTISLKNFKKFEYKYIVKDYGTGKIINTDSMTRKIKISYFTIDFKKPSFCVLTINDIWGSPKESRVVFDQIPLVQDKCCVVLGKNLAPDGSPLKELIARMEKIAEIIKKEPKYYKNIILTGGKVKQIINYEAEVMFNLGLKLDINENIMIKEKEAKTTFENAIFTKILIVKLGIVNIEILTSSYHLERSEQLFKSVFGSNIFNFKSISDDVVLDENYVKKTEGKEVYRIKELPSLFEYFGF